MIFEEGTYLPALAPYRRSSGSTPVCHCCGVQQAQGSWLCLVSAASDPILCPELLCNLRLSIKGWACAHLEGQGLHRLKWSLTNRERKPRKATTVPPFNALGFIGLRRCCVFYKLQARLVINKKITACFSWWCETKPTTYPKYAWTRLYTGLWQGEFYMISLRVPRTLSPNFHSKVN